LRAREGEEVQVQGFVSGIVLRNFERFVVRMLGPSVKGKGRLRMRFIEEESGLPNDEGLGGYSFYATPWLRPLPTQWFGKLIASYRIELLAWNPEDRDSSGWKAQFRISWRARIFEFLGERAWIHAWYRPGDGRWCTDHEYEARRQREQDA
jgi:hypothetical protein